MKSNDGLHLSQTGGRNVSQNISQNVSDLQQRHHQEERRSAVRALLMTPLMSPAHDDFAAVRRHAEWLREWFAREAGWTLHVEREGARLYKRPADLANATRGLPGYDKRRYVLLCLACAVLERADAQITLSLLGERLLQLAAEPLLAARGFVFTLGAQHERRELVAVCRTLLGLGALQRVAGDEDAFVQGSGEQADALYDVHRRTLAGLLAAVRGPSTWAAEEAPVSLSQRLVALTEEHLADSDEGRRGALRHQIARRLLDDPVVYTAQLEPEARAYFINQRGPLASRLCEATGLVAEQRAEGLALTDDSGSLTDVAMPAEGTEAHATLLVAEFLARGLRSGKTNGDAARDPALGPSRERASQPAHPPAHQPALQPAHEPASLREQDVADFLREAREHFGRYWRKSAREAGSERELAAVALERLEKLQLVSRSAGRVTPLPALARFALGESEVRSAAPPLASGATLSLF